MKIKGLVKKLNRRLSGRGGESIAEVLIALLISSLGIVMLAAMITASARLLTKSRDSIERYVDAENRLAEQGSSSLSGTVTLQAQNGSSLRLKDGLGADIDVLYYLNDESGGDAVVSYRADE